jgi:amino acid transporter
MAAYKALPKVFGDVHPRYQTPTASTWAMGIMSVVFYAGLTWLSPGSLNDLIAAIGLMIAFYYGFTGFASAWAFRRNAHGKDLWQKVILPSLGGVILFAAFVKTAIDSYASDFGETAPLGIGGVFLLGIGSILLGVALMVIWQVVRPEYFGGTTMPEGVSVGERGEMRTAD